MPCTRSAWDLLYSRSGEEHQVQKAHPQHFLDRLHAAPEQVHVELLKARARNGQVEVDALKQRVDLNARLQSTEIVSGTAGSVSCTTAWCLGCCMTLQM